MLTLLHTAESHVPAFAELAARIAPDAPLTQQVRADWLARAQAGGDAALADEIAQSVRAADGPVIVTCTTIGDMAEAAGAQRIDRPMMARAAEIGGPVLMAYCLASTEETSMRALRDAFDAAGKPVDITPLFLGKYWPFFEAGETAEFHAMLAAAIENVAEGNPPACIVLAQASMAGAADRLSHLGFRVLNSPELALRAGFGLPVGI